MEIKEFSELTSFLVDESLKIMDSFGLKKFDSIVLFAEKELKKYMKLYSMPVYRKAKREIELAEAIDTMPHGFIWKIFHSKLWQQIQELEKNKQDEIPIFVESKQAESTEYYPMVINQAESPVVISEDETENN